MILVSVKIRNQHVGIINALVEIEAIAYIK